MHSIKRSSIKLTRSPFMSLESYVRTVNGKCVQQIRHQWTTGRRMSSFDILGATMKQHLPPSFRESFLREFFLKPRTLPVPRWIRPQPTTLTLSEMFGHCSFILVAASYAVDDYIHLRIMAVAGSSAMLVMTYFHPHGRVLWLPFQWNCLFIVLNSYRIGKVYLNRYLAEHLSPQLIQLRNVHFRIMDPLDFAKLVRGGKLETFKAGETVISQVR